jgi:hypothetical protein
MRRLFWQLHACAGHACEFDLEAEEYVLLPKARA